MTLQTLLGNSDLVMFMAEGTATGIDPKFQAGNRHALIVLLKQDKGDEPDIVRALLVAERDGWSKLEIEEAAVVDLEAEPDPEFREALALAYESTIRDGFHVLRFTDPIT